MKKSKRKYYKLKLFYQDGRQYKCFLFDDYYDVIACYEKYTSLGYKYSIEVI